MVCGAQCVVWVPLMLPPSVVWLDMLEVFFKILEVVFLIFMFYYNLQYQSTLPHPQCLEMVTVQLSTDLAAMDVKQASAIAVKITYLTFSCSRQSIAGVRCKHGLKI